MDVLWSPWRFQYLRQGTPAGQCVFCEKAQPGHEDENLVVFRGEWAYVLLNLYPYSAGHVLIAPYEHVPTLEEASAEALTEVMLLARRTQAALGRVYQPPGFNLGINLGECAGAGVAGHLHLHVLPRWPGDANFMTTIGETRVLPEELPITLQRLRSAFANDLTAHPAPDAPARS